MVGWIQAGIMGPLSVTFVQQTEVDLTRLRRLTKWFGAMYARFSWNIAYIDVDRVAIYDDTLENFDKPWGAKEFL